MSLKGKAAVMAGDGIGIGKGVSKGLAK